MFFVLTAYYFHFGCQRHDYKLFVVRMCASVSQSSISRTTQLKEWWVNIAHKMKIRLFLLMTIFCAVILLAESDNFPENQKETEFVTHIN